MALAAAPNWGQTFCTSLHPLFQTPSFFAPTSLLISKTHDMRAPGTDQTTRSRQQWHILAPLVGTQYDITNDCTSASGDTHLGNFLRGDYTWNAFDRLVHRAPADADEIEEILTKLPRSECTSQGSLLEKLPNEMLTMVFNDDELTASDVLALGLCSRGLWQRCLGHIRANVSKGSWASTPLLCTGTYLTSMPRIALDLDPSLSEPEQIWRTRQPAPGRGMRGGRGMCPARRWNWNAVSEYINDVEGTSEKYLNAFDATFSAQRNDIPSTDRTILRQTLSLLLSSNNPRPGSHWTLRNHTTQQYIVLKCAFNGAMEPQLNVKGLPLLSLDKALIMRICWTDNDIYESSIPAMRKLVHGPWAGHKFDIVDDFKQGKGWTEVTEEMMAKWKDFTNLYRLHHG